MIKVLALFLFITLSVFSVFGQSDSSKTAKRVVHSGPFGNIDDIPKLSIDSIITQTIKNSKIIGTWIFTKMKLYKNESKVKPENNDKPFDTLFVNSDRTITLTKGFKTSMYYWTSPQLTKSFNLYMSYNDGKNVHPSYFEIDIKKLTKSKLILILKDQEKGLKGTIVYKKKKS